MSDVVAQVIARTKKLRELAATGYSNAEIGEVFGVGPRTVQRWRAMAHIPSTWTPETAALVHGTPSGYRHHGCPCTPCKRADRDANAERRARYQRETARTATRHLEPWTDGDDAVVMTRGALEAAQVLSRTYDAVRARRQRLNERRTLTAAIRAQAAAQRAQGANTRQEAQTS